MKNVLFVKNVRTGKDLFVNIKCRSEETLIRRIERETLMNFSHINNEGNHIFQKPNDSMLIVREYCIRYK